MENSDLAPVTDIAPNRQYASSLKFGEGMTNSDAT